jgi:hypothetical protein
MIRIVLLCVLVAYFTSCATTKKQDSPPTAKDQTITKKVEGPPAPSAAPKASTDKREVVTCTRDHDSRKIEILKEPARKVSEESAVADKVCEVIYQKFGKEKSVAQAQKQVSFCDTVGKRIRTNLESAGYTCR